MASASRLDCDPKRGGEEQGLRPRSQGFTSLTQAIEELPSSNHQIERYDILRARQCGVSAEHQDEQLLYMTDSVPNTLHRLTAGPANKTKM